MVSQRPVVIVSGGTYGIGRAITLTLADRGWQVVAFGLDAPQVGSVAQNGSTETLEALRARGLEADILDGDVSNADDVSRIVTTCKDRHGRIDALVNNAAIHPRGTILETERETWDRVMAVNLTGVYELSKSVIPHLIDREGGSIVNIGSGSGWGKPNLLAYSASKGGVFALTMAMAYDHLHQHIRVNAVVPGGTLSGMTTGEAGLPGFAESQAKRTVTGRVTQPQDLANAVAFLLSDDASQITGTILDVGCFSHQGGPIPVHR